MKSKLPKSHYLLPITITLFLLPITLLSQNFQWLQSGGGINSISSKEEVVDIVTDSQRNIYVLSAITMDNVNVNNGAPVAVTTYEANPNRYDFILISYTCNGTYRWHKVFGGGGPDFPSGIVIDNQDNVYISGRVTQCSENNGSNPFYSMPRIGDNNGIDFTFSNTSTSCLHMFIAKFNTNGVFQWIHFAHAPLDSSVANDSGIARNFYIVNDVIYWLVQLAPGSYENGAFNNTNTAVPYTTYILKYDTSGTFINAIAFDLQVSSYISSEVRWYRNPYNGNFYAIHAYNSNNNNTITAGGNTLSNTFSKIICFNDQGQYQWHRETTGTSMNLTSIDFDAQNNIYLSGLTLNFVPGSFLGWTLPGSNTGAAAFVMKCNPNVTSYSWVSHYNPANNFLDGNILYTPSHIYLSGSFNGVSLTWGTQSVVGPGSNNGRDAIIVSLDPTTGNCTSLNRLVGNNGFDDGFTKMILDSNGDLLLGGYMGYQLTDSNNVNYYSNGGNSDFFITKFATQACTPLANETFESQNINLYPNPTNYAVELQNINQEYNYALYAITGVCVQKGVVNIENNYINVESLSSGMYMLQLHDKNGNLSSYKVIKE
ncbi:T9SS type A sorting domain-containing protein [uncultured Flavobacterium sp.]|uniref:T9SS type A sorting domain-containing protein n=1 Tax=uncultured Flavobacterium sp. TaxID=165435 RepID=UPI0030C7B921